MEIKDKCVCGAKFSVTDNSYSTCSSIYQLFLAEHKSCRIAYSVKELTIQKPIEKQEKSE